jgi:hypothetical protein
MPCLVFTLIFHTCALICPPPPLLKHHPRAGHPHHEKAVSILARMNPNADKNSTASMNGTERRFVKFGGALSDAQLVGAGVLA